MKFLNGLPISMEKFVLEQHVRKNEQPVRKNDQPVTSFTYPNFVFFFLILRGISPNFLYP